MPQVYNQCQGTTFFFVNGTNNCATVDLVESTKERKTHIPVHEASTSNGPFRTATSTPQSVSRRMDTTHTPYITPSLLPKPNQHKTPYLRDPVTYSDQAIWMAVTEMHLTADIAHAEIQILRYILFRANRKHRTCETEMFSQENITPVVLVYHANLVCDLLIMQIKKLRR